MQGERRVTQQRDCRALTAGLEVLLKLWKGLDKDTLHKGHQLAVWRAAGAREPWLSRIPDGPTQARALGTLAVQVSRDSEPATCRPGSIRHHSALLAPSGWARLGSPH